MPVLVTVTAPLWPLPPPTPRPEIALIAVVTALMSPLLVTLTAPLVAEDASPDCATTPAPLDEVRLPVLVTVTAPLLPPLDALPEIALIAVLATLMSPMLATLTAPVVAEAVPD